MTTCLVHTAPGGNIKHVQLVGLLAAGIGADKFTGRRMVAAVHGSGLALCIVAAQPVLELLVNRTATDAVHEVVVGFPLGQDYSQMWFLDILLAGMGVLLYASNHVDDLVLAAPFPGTQGTIAEIAIAGGFASQFAPRAVSTVIEEGMLN